MKTVFAIIFSAALAWVSAPLHADSSNTQSSSTTKSSVVGYPPEPARYIFEIQFTAINGEHIIPNGKLELEPGTYTLTARIPAEYTRTAVAQRVRKWDEDVDFELVVEPDARYRVRGQWNRNDADKPFELVTERVR